MSTLSAELKVHTVPAEERLRWFLTILSVEERVELSKSGPKWLTLFDGTLPGPNTLQRAVSMGLARTDTLDAWFGAPEVFLTEAGRRWLRDNPL